jgi:hypothetical protein
VEAAVLDLPAQLQLSEAAVVEVEALVLAVCFFRPCLFLMFFMCLLHPVVLLDLPPERPVVPVPRR